MPGRFDWSHVLGIVFVAGSLLLTQKALAGERFACICIYADFRPGSSVTGFYKRGVKDPEEHKIAGGMTRSICNSSPALLDGSDSISFWIERHPDGTSWRHRWMLSPSILTNNGGSEDLACANVPPQSTFRLEYLPGSGDQRLRMVQASRQQTLGAVDKLEPPAGDAPSLPAPPAPAAPAAAAAAKTVEPRLQGRGGKP